MKNNNFNYTISDLELNVNCIVEKRKSIVIIVKGKKKLTIKAPVYFSKKQVLNFIAKKEKWIYKHCNEYIDVISGIYDFREILYLGNTYNILIDQRLNSVEIQGNLLLIPDSFNKADLLNWYKGETIKQVDSIYKTLNFEKNPSKILVKKQKSRWGSCTSKGNIYLNSRLAMCPIEVIKYVIIHELCHLVHMDHSKRFYNLISQYMPEYKIHKKWLKDNNYKTLI